MDQCLSLHQSAFLIANFMLPLSSCGPLKRHNSWTRKAMLLGAVIQIDKGTTLGPHLPFLTSDGMELISLSPAHRWRRNSCLNHAHQLCCSSPLPSPVLLMGQCTRAKLKTFSSKGTTSSVPILMSLTGPLAQQLALSYSHFSSPVRNG